ncbi:lipoprotein [Tatumella sp. UBA2305]|uniref:lipoprotein n=1 Tax=Tatumella sp. UBA2305 TaxID=1947647 RepID=UPI0025FD0994|nr:lipoprotein [Tatumella sp. UBA2305]
MLKRAIFPLLAAFALAGCATSSNTLDVTPKITLPQQDPSLMGVTVSINGADQRSSQALAQVTRDNQLVTLTPSRDLRFLLQEVLEKQMAARGYMIGPNGAVDLQIVVNKLYADVTQGNLRYSITTNADVSITATAKNGNKQMKTYRQTYSVEGPFTANNDKITKAVNSTLGDVISDMAADTSINDFIKQNSH